MITRFVTGSNPGRKVDEGWGMLLRLNDFNQRGINALVDDLHVFVNEPSPKVLRVAAGHDFVQHHTARNDGALTRASQNIFVVRPTTTPTSVAPKIPRGASPAPVRCRWGS